MVVMGHHRGQTFAFVQIYFLESATCKFFASENCCESMNLFDFLFFVETAKVFIFTEFVVSVKRCHLEIQRQKLRLNFFS